MSEEGEATKEGRTIMEIVKEWTTMELISYLNSYRNISLQEKADQYQLMVWVREELIQRQPLIGSTYKL